MQRVTRPKTRVKISDVADALGLSKGTVSRAMNAYPDISESTQLRVKRMAERMGYRPLSHAQAIKTGRVRALGLVLETTEYDGHAPFLTTFLSGVSEEASDNGWTLTVATAQSGIDMERTLLRLIHEHKADGFILPRTRVNDPRVKILKDQSVPHVLFGRTGYGTNKNNGNLSWFDIAGGDAMRRAVRHLAGLGHKRIGFLGALNEYNYTHLRHDGYLKGIAESNLSYDPQIDVQGIQRSEEADAATRNLLRLPQPPTAIIGATDAIALGVYDAAEHFGLSIGSDLSVIGYDGIPQGSYAKPKLSSFQVDSYQAGRQLASLLIRQIRGEDPQELREIASAHFVRGGSENAPSMNSAQLAQRLTE
ncbi:MAG: LacI family DNA-binding transcriptional regulator [Cognatishimia sp.]